MKPATSLIALLCLTSPLAVHRAIAEQLNYTLHVVGIPVADAALTINTTGSAYRAVMRFHTTGLANLVDGSSLKKPSAAKSKTIGRHLRSTARTAICMGRTASWI